MQQVLPFFGFVPAKAELTMTPAQIRAAELMYARCRADRALRTKRSNRK
jgi:hypothetical protein